MYSYIQGIASGTYHTSKALFYNGLLIIQFCSITTDRSNFELSNDRVSRSCTTSHQSTNSSKMIRDYAECCVYETDREREERGRERKREREVTVKLNQQANTPNLCMTILAKSTYAWFGVQLIKQGGSDVCLWYVL